MGTHIRNKHAITAAAGIQAAPKAPPPTATAGTVSVDARALRDALAPYSKAVSQRPTLPILGCVRLTTTDTHLVIDATNREVTLTTRVPATIHPQASKLQAAVPYPSMLAAATAAVPKAPADAATVELHGNNDHLIISSMLADGRMRQQQRLRLGDVEDFPPLPPLDPQPDRQGRAVDGAALARAITQVHPAVGNDPGRPVLAAMLVELASDRVTVAATDGHRLAVRTIPSLSPHPLHDPTERLAALVPRDALPLIRALYATSPTVTLHRADGSLTLADHTTTLALRPIDGDFPPFRDWLPKVDPARDGRLDVDRQLLLDALQRLPHSRPAARPAARDPVTLQIDDDTLALTATLQDVSTTTIMLPARSERLDGMQVAFNPSYLADGLAGFTGPVTIWLRDPRKPALLLPTDATPSAEPDSLYLLMPVTLRS